MYVNSLIIIISIIQERDEALVDLRRTIVERDSLRERLKISSDNQISDKAHLEQQVEDLNNRLRMLHNDKSQLDMQVMFDMQVGFVGYKYFFYFWYISLYKNKYKKLHDHCKFFYFSANC